MLAFFGGMGLLLLRMGFYPSRTIIDFERRAFLFRNVWGKTSMLAFNQVAAITPVSLKLNGAPLGVHFRAVPIGATTGQQPISPTFRDNELAAEFGVVMFAEITKNLTVITPSEWMQNPE